MIHQSFDALWQLRLQGLYRLLMGAVADRERCPLPDVEQIRKFHQMQEKAKQPATAGKGDLR